MIVVGGPQLDPAQAARRAAARDAPFWICLAAHGSDHVIAADVVGCEPDRIALGGDVGELEAAWAEARGAWSAAGAPAGTGIPLAVGCLGYDLGRRFERLPSRAADDHGFADVEFHFHDAVWIRDGAGSCLIAARDQHAARRLAAVLGIPVRDGPAPALGALRADRPDGEHLDGVRRILEYIVAGDTYQVNLARRLSAAIGDGDPVWLAERLRAEAPAPHAFWMRCAGGRGAIVGNSPELFLRTDGAGAIETRPIKGTRPRGADAAADARALGDLRASAKDRAEHVMIVDLERNDLGRVCQPGSVVVDRLLRPVALPTVHHLVSTVRGRLSDAVGFAAILRATFPGGSVTGAPKIRAMEIIDEIEPARRGPYTGATGWLGAAGDMDLAVAIRTAAVRDGTLRLWVGGGIVADSDPDAELRETETKAAAFARIFAAA